MKAPDWQSIYDFETAIESAVANVLLAKVTHRVYTSRHADPVGNPRISVEFTPGEATGHHGVRVADRQPFLDTWKGQLVVEVVTSRKLTAGSHAPLRSAVRHYARQLPLLNAESRLPYHKINWCADAGTQPTIRTEDDEDVSSIAFDLTFSVRADAWPDADPTE